MQIPRPDAPVTDALLRFRAILVLRFTFSFDIVPENLVPLLSTACGLHSPYIHMMLFLRKMILISNCSYTVSPPRFHARPNTPFLVCKISPMDIVIEAVHMQIRVPGEVRRGQRRLSQEHRR